MKIAINAIPYTSWQGIEVFLSGILNSWPDNQLDEVVVFANKKSAQFLSPLPDNIKLKIINFNILNRIIIFLYLQIIFPYNLKKGKFDILFCPSLLSPWFYNRKIVTIHDAAPFVLKNENSLLGKIFWSINLFFAKLTSLKIITVSNFSKKELINNLRVDQNNIEVIYNGTREPVKSSLTPNSKWKEINYIVVIGNARPRKNLLLLFKAFNLLTNEIHNIKLIVIGKNDDNMKTLGKNYKVLNDNIIFTGFISESEKTDIIKNAKILVFPSLYEGFGLPILEAEILEIPVVCSDIPAFREIASDSAVFFDPRNEEDMKEKIKQILQSDSLVNTLKIKGRKNCLRFNWENSSSHLINIIHTYENTSNK